MRRNVWYAVAGSLLLAGAISGGMVFASGTQSSKATEATEKISGSEVLEVEADRSAETEVNEDLQEMASALVETAEIQIQTLSERIKETETDPLREIYEVDTFWFGKKLLSMEMNESWSDEFHVEIEGNQIFFYYNECEVSDHCLLMSLEVSSSKMPLHSAGHVATVDLGEFYVHAAAAEEICSHTQDGEFLPELCDQYDIMADCIEEMLDTVRIQNME